MSNSRSQPCLLSPSCTLLNLLRVYCCWAGTSAPLCLAKTFGRVMNDLTYPLFLSVFFIGEWSIWCRAVDGFCLLWVGVSEDDLIWILLFQTETRWVGGELLCCFFPTFWQRLSAIIGCSNLSSFSHLCLCFKLKRKFALYLNFFFTFLIIEQYLWFLNYN